MHNQVICSLAEGCNFQCSVELSMNAFRHLLVSTKVTLANIIGMLILSGAVLLVIAQVLKADLGRQAIDMQRLSMEVAWSALHEAGREISIRDGQLRAGETVLNGNNAIVDKIKRVTGGTATIFQGDTRVATNVLKPDGSRAVGTTLAKGPAYDAVFSRGESYRGPVDILGERYYAAYDPLKDQCGPGGWRALRRIEEGRPLQELRP